MVLGKGKPLLNRFWPLCFINFRQNTVHSLFNNAVLCTNSSGAIVCKNIAFESRYHTKCITVRKTRGISFNLRLKFLYTAKIISLFAFVCLFRSREECCNNLRIELENLNSSKQGFVDEVINKIIGNAIGHIRYHFIDNNGPKYGTVTKEHSISVR